MAPVLELNMLGDNRLVKILARGETGDVDHGMSEFYVYKALLQKASPYFQALKNFKEGEEDVVEFKDVDPKAVGTFVYWLHTGKLPEDPQYQDLSALVSAYAFGDRILAAPFKDFITDRVRGRGYTGFDWPNTVMLYYSPKTLMLLREAGLRPSDGLVRYLIDHIAYNIVVLGSSASATGLSDEDHEFMRTGGAWVCSLMQRVMCVADKFRNSVQANSWDSPPKEPSPLQPSNDLSGAYHESTDALDNDGLGPGNRMTLNW